MTLPTLNKRPKNRQKIAIDIDDVLADNATGFVNFSNKTWGTTLQPEDYHEHWMELWNVDLVEAERRAIILTNASIFKNYTHDEAALPVLKRLSADYDLCIVTSRREHTRDDTLAWIHQHYEGLFNDETIHYAGIWDKGITLSGLSLTKADVIAQLDADYLIDDQLKHCEGVAQTGRKALLFGNYKWNQVDELPSGVTRVNDWAAVEEHFYGK
ncbi:MAG: hypothetical protein JWO54_598 [Candidatus Saccharibacteria bacterium]|nr:hypothetical protein [Candidatus Saccharibacteria bacterium]MDB5180838.1 hypothetical protein [Candidatus Saccharibacteria bacterium]